MSDVIDMQEEYLVELRKFPKVAKAELWGDALLIETNPMHLYTDERDFRAPLGRFLVVFHHTEVVVKNYDAIGNYKKDLHHPHVDGNYVSLAAHAGPLNNAIDTQDWLTCGFIIIKFLEEYKFGEKAKKFFEANGMERKDPETKEWKPVTEKDQKEILKKDARFRMSGGYSYAGGTSRPGRWNAEDDEKDRLLNEYFPVGTRIRLNWTNSTSGLGTHNVEPGTFGEVIEKEWPSQKALSVRWERNAQGQEQGKYFKPSLTVDDFDAINPGTGEVIINSLALKEKLTEYMEKWDDDYDSAISDPITETRGPSRSAGSFRNGSQLGVGSGFISDEDRIQDAKDDVFKKAILEHFPVGCTIEFVQSNAVNIMTQFEEGDRGKVTNVGFKTLYAKWDNGKRFTPMFVFDKVNRVDPDTGEVLSTFDEALAEAEEAWKKKEQDMKSRRDGEGGESFATALSRSLEVGDDGEENYGGYWI